MQYIETNNTVYFEISDFENGLDSLPASDRPQGRFENIMKCHNHVYSTYSDIKEIVYPSYRIPIEIKVPSGNWIFINSGKAIDGEIYIKVQSSINFNNNKIVVTNNSGKTINLFQFVNRRLFLGTKVTRRDIDRGIFTHIPELNDGLKLLVVTDEHTWAHRTNNGTTENVYRQDVILVKDGIAMNAPIAPYNTATTYATTSFCNATEEKKCFRNLELVRDVGSTNITKLLYAESVNNLEINNIIVRFSNDTPVSLSGEHCIQIKSSTNLSFYNVRIINTYSSLTNHGYGIALENIWNLNMFNVIGEADWGIMGCNFINKAYLYNCTLNRFDIHCYGCDVTCSHCIFENNHSKACVANKHNYNRLSCFYGDFYYKDCTFNDFRPLVIDSSYHIYTGFNLILDNCTINTGNNSNHMIEIGNLGNEVAVRPEHQQKCWPNLIVKELTIKPQNAQSTTRSNYTIFHTIDTPSSSIVIKYLNLITFTLTNASGVYDFLEVKYGNNTIPTGRIHTDYPLQRNLNVGSSCTFIRVLNVEPNQI